MIKPRLARLFAAFRERELPVIMHSMGKSKRFLPDLVEIGLTTLNPVQPEVLDHAWLRKTFGNKLTYYGGISTQTVLPNGTPEEVRQAAIDCRQLLAPDGTGLKNDRPLTPHDDRHPAGECRSYAKNPSGKRQLLYKFSNHRSLNE